MADDGSGAPPRDVVARFAHHIRVSLVEAQHGGPGAARNAAATRARGAYLALTDDDCQPSPGWLTAMDAAVTARPDALVGGRVENGLPANLMAAASQLVVAYLYEYYARSDRSKLRFFTTNNIAIPLDAFRRLGGFNELATRETAEDRDLCDRWLRSGGSLVYEPAALVQHYSPLTLRSFVAQHFRYGRGAVHFHRARARRAAERVRLEPLSFYAAMLWYPMEHSPRWHGPVHSVLVAVSQISYAAGYLAERSRRTRAGHAAA